MISHIPKAKQSSDTSTSCHFHFIVGAFGCGSEASVICHVGKPGLSGWVSGGVKLEDGVHVVLALTLG